MPPPKKSRLAIVGVAVLMVGLNTCVALIFLALAGVSGQLGPALFGAGLLLTFVGMGILFLFLILRLAQK